MVFEVIYDLVYISVGFSIRPRYACPRSRQVVVPTKPTSTCASGVYFMMATLGTYVTCQHFAEHLVLTICVHVSP